MTKRALIILVVRHQYTVRGSFHEANIDYFAYIVKFISSYYF